VKVPFYESLLRHPELVRARKIMRESGDDVKPNRSTATTGQQILVIQTVMEHGKLIYEDVNDSDYAKLAHFLTGKNYDNIRKQWPNIHRKSKKERLKDINAVRHLFEAIDAHALVEKLLRDLERDEE
jgi:hypothetical protein